MAYWEQEIADAAITRQCYRVSIEPGLQCYTHDAVARFSYLHPSIGTEIQDASIEFSIPQGVDHESLVQDFRFILYRQKIYSETLLIRRVLIEGLMVR
ncbi:MAG: hypothetical protein ACYC10_11305 [Allorhizobium sp.]